MIFSEFLAAAKPSFSVLIWAEIEPLDHLALQGRELGDKGLRLSASGELVTLHRFEQIHNASCRGCFAIAMLGIKRQTFIFRSMERLTQFTLLPYG